MKIIKVRESLFDSVSDIHLVAQRIEQEGGVTVISGSQKLHNQLKDLLHIKDYSLKEAFKKVTIIADEQKKTAEELHLSISFMGILNSLCDQLRNIIRGICLIKECSARSRDYIMSFAQKICCHCLVDMLRMRGRKARYYDASQLLVPHPKYDMIMRRESEEKIHANLSADVLAIVAGLFHSPENGTILQETQGGDYTASLIASALGADCLEIWTAGECFYRVDPSIVSEAQIIDNIDPHEAMELCYFGFSLIHPYTLIPAIEQNIPLFIKDIHTGQGTWVRKQDAKKGTNSPDASITGIASIADVALLNIEGNGMVGARGIASQVFNSLAKAQINVIMISQASSEQSICVICHQSDVRKAQHYLEKNLASYLFSRKITRIERRENLEIVAVVGSSMRGRRGIAGRIFQTLGKQGINVVAISQGSSEMNISFVIEKVDTSRALHALYGTFFS